MVILVKAEKQKHGVLFNNDDVCVCERVPVTLSQQPTSPSKKTQRAAEEHRVSAFLRLDSIFAFFFIFVPFKVTERIESDSTAAVLIHSHLWPLEECRRAVKDFVDWCELNQLHINASKTKEVVLYFCRKMNQTTVINIQGSNIEMHTDTWAFTTSINWTHLTNKDVLYAKKGPCCLYLLTFSDIVVSLFL